MTTNEETAPLMTTVSGVRGIAGVSLTRGVVRKYVHAFAQQQHEQDEKDGGKAGDTAHSKSGKRRIMILGRDSRVSGPWVRDAAAEALADSGYDVVDCGVVPTPTVQVQVQRRRASGGVVVTSSHNAAPWNGLKFVDRDGLFLRPERCRTLFAAADVWAAARGSVDSTLADGTAVAEHVAAILGQPYIDVKVVRACGLRVVVDAVCGAGGQAMALVLRQLGCAEVVMLHGEPSGVFPHMPEPIPAHLGELCGAVVAQGADLGIAVDPDVDRCVLIDERGVPLGEEYTLALAVQFMLGDVGRRGPVCKNLSTTRAVDDIARAHGCVTHATPVGEIHVAQRMAAVGAVIGGEGNGGVMLPDVHIGRDAPVAAALVLQCFANARVRARAKAPDAPPLTISQLKATLPQYEIVKAKVDTAAAGGLDTTAVLAALQHEWLAVPGITINTDDGLHIAGADWWVHIRASNTEPIMRVIAEAHTAAQAQLHCTEFLDKIASLKQQQPHHHQPQCP
jgi:phosphomannomutase